LTDDVVSAPPQQLKSKLVFSAVPATAAAAADAAATSDAKALADSSATEEEIAKVGVLRQHELLFSITTALPREKRLPGGHLASWAYHSC